MSEINKKKELLEEAKVLEASIVEEVEHLQEDIWHKVKTGATLLAVGVGTYLIVKKLLNYPVKLEHFVDNTQKNTETQENDTKIAYKEPNLDIVEMIKKEMAVFLLGIAKQKIYELLQKLYFTQEAENLEEDDQEDTQ
ncbi:hypothetical protein AD998_16605 [bacterium 336/3]|jgi:hypothetical protein|nr:hypothetical protein AD998_16605 [bacterium 336/3]